MKKILSIEFCTSWGYIEKAVNALGVLARLYEKEVLEFRLIPSSGGVFEVMLGDKLLFSKKIIKRFPEIDELIESMKKEL